MTINSVSQHVTRLKEILFEVYHYKKAAHMLSVHQDTYMPPANAAYAGKTRGFHLKKAHEAFTSREMADLLSSLRESSVFQNLSKDDKSLVLRVGQSFDRSFKIPSSLVASLSEATSRANPVWVKAKQNNDFPSFVPNLREIFDLKKQVSQAAGAEGSPYNFHLDAYEEGMNTSKLDEVFRTVKANLVPLVLAIMDSKTKIKTDFLQVSDTSSQIKLAEELLKTIGFDFNRGRIAPTEHGFCSLLFPNETVIGIREKKDIADFLGLVIHEGGHAIHDQGIDTKFYGTPLYSGPSLGICESQSRLYENHIGKSLPFWKFYFDKVQQYYPAEFTGVGVEDFYKAINSVSPSLIRTQADEVTYNLHVILRYEIERDIFEGKIDIKDLPEVWTNKMREYLGVVPSTDSEGVLQDIHWAYGSIGYFPTYTLGNMAAAQIFAQMEKEIPSLDSLIESGDFVPIREWLVDKVHKYGDSLSPEEVLKGVTGTGYDSKPLADYQRAKFSTIYNVTV